MTLDKLFEHGKKAAETLFDRQGSIQPMWICETENGQMIPICIEMPDRDDRDAVSEALKETFKRHKVVRYVAILEAWTLVMPTDFDPAKGYDGSLQHHPDRREVVFLSAEDKDGHEKGGLFFILRPEHGKPKLSPFEAMDNSKGSSGRFSRLLSTEH